MTTKLTLFRNNIAAEWMRLWSVRSSWFFALCTVVGALGVAFLAAFVLASTAPAGGSPWKISSMIGLPILFGLLILSTIAASADHATGNIAPTFQWTPQRGMVLAARTTVIVLTATILGSLLVAGVALIIWLNAPQLIYFTDHTTQALGRAAFVYSSCALLALGISLTMRNTAAALTTVFGLILGLPLVFQAIPLSWVTTFIELLPGSGALFFFLGEGPGDTMMNDTNSSLTLIIWALSVFLIGGLRLLRADAR